MNKSTIIYCFLDYLQYRENKKNFIKKNNFLLVETKIITSMIIGSILD